MVQQRRHFAELCVPAEPDRASHSLGLLVTLDMSYEYNLLHIVVFYIFCCISCANKVPSFLFCVVTLL